MVERKPVKISPGLVAKAENLVSTVKSSVSPSQLAQLKSFFDAPRSELRAEALALPHNQRSSFLQTLKNSASGLLSAVSGVAPIINMISKVPFLSKT